MLGKPSVGGKMKVARVRQMSRLEGDLRADGYELTATILASEGRLLISIPIKKADVKRITDYWNCVRVVTRT